MNRVAINMDVKASPYLDVESLQYILGGIKQGHSIVSFNVFDEISMLGHECILSLTVNDHHPFSTCKHAFVITYFLVYNQSY